jgi:hypothetical protein
MPRYSRYNRAFAKPKTQKLTKQDHAKAAKYLCFALHDIPSSDLLATQPWHLESSYMPSWVVPKLNKVDSGATCMVYLHPKTVALLPLPDSLDSQDAPYAIGYSFAIAQQNNLINGEHYVEVGKYYGFTIATLPSHDWKRALSFASLNRPSDALLHADRAIVSLATLFPERLEEVEKPFARFEKLVRLYVDQSDQPEGMLSFNLALKQALKCINVLSDGRIS